MILNKDNKMPKMSKRSKRHLLISKNSEGYCKIGYKDRDYFATWDDYGVETDYRTETSCSESGCYEDNICRCGTILDAKVISVDIRSIANALANNSDSIIDTYCIDRILVANHIWSEDLWDIDISDGYYGQEMDGVYLDQSLAAKCEEQIEHIRKLKENMDKIEFVLNLEYGYILEEAKNRKWSIVNIPFEKLDFGKDHYRKLDKNIVLKYKDYSLPKGICLIKGDRYRLIDGYHRCSASEKDNINIDVIVG